jgi:uncharacterized membrane protein YoaK (UPF0700 family)
MWSNFFEAGGWGMYPTLVYGFALLATMALFALRGDPRFRRAALAFGALTFASGVLGTSVGICTTVHYALTVPPAEQLSTLAAGCEESLHNLVLALILVIVAAMIAAVNAFRRQAP